MDKPVLATGVKALRGWTTLTGQEALSRQLHVRRCKLTDMLHHRVIQNVIALALHEMSE